MIPPMPSNQLIASLEEIGPNNHLCLIYESQNEQFAVAVPFIRIGLDRGEKCVYIADDDNEDDFREALRAGGVDVDRALASKALVLTSKERTYPKHGCCDAEGMFEFWQGMTESAISEGFSALRATGDQSLDRWLEYKKRIFGTLSEGDCYALCQYNRRMFAPEILLNAIRTHPIVICRDKVSHNPYYVPPGEFLAGNEAESELAWILANIGEREGVESALAERQEELKKIHSMQRQQQTKLQHANESLVEVACQRRRIETELLAAEDSLATELAAMTRLHEFCTRLVPSMEFKPLLEEILRASIELQNADFGMVQLYERQTQMLEVVSQHGFSRDILDRFKSRRDDTTICGRALLQRQRVIIEDVQVDPDFGPQLALADAAGFRAVQSTPLFNRNGEPWGVLSTCFRQPHRPSERELRFTDLYVTYAAEIVERRRAEEALHKSEESFRLLVDGINDYAIFGLSPEGMVTSWNAGAERIKGYHEEEIIGRHFSCFYLPEESHSGAPQRCLEAAAREGRYEAQGWRLRKNGMQFWADVVITAIRDHHGKLLGYSKVVRDITERRLAEKQLCRSETYLTESQRLSHTGSWAWDVATGELFWSREHFRIFGLDTERTTPTYEMFLQMVHPEDRLFIRQTFETVVSEKRNFDEGYRVVRPDKTIRHIRSMAHPVFDASKNLAEYVGTVIDITEEVEAKTELAQAFEEIHGLKERLHHENVALREEIDRTAMFEEIVGSSPAIKSVLSRVAKVAPTDSTVIITGETGTGKELIARAIHKRSNRNNRPFVAFNCAGVPISLIASELFGHEKGAFTGAHQRRLGRFELAEGGTIFLDEVGELPGETQIALLRVLQEREFERVGGGKPVSANVRIIAATNRNLEDAIVEGTFRLDLFYRLNVFPIEMPPLRERKEDIPMLLDYFIKRYADKAGKRISGVDKRTIELFTTYSWPGNIRELQNVIERSVIVCENGIFSVDANWLSGVPAQPHGHTSNLAENLREQEKTIIETVLAASKGRIAGRHGAAAKLGVPSSTLESKIKTLNIRKNYFKADY